MHGRGREQAVLRGLLAQAGQRGSALIIRGPAGIGKSTLVDDARATALASGFRVLTCAGVQRESSSGLAGLQQLLHVVVDRADQLPDRQRAALHSVFGLGPGTSPDPLVLAVAVLALLEDLAQEQPLLLIVEDVQWLDEPTANLIGFVGRRLRDSAIVMLLTRRSEAGDPGTDPGLPEVVLDRLTDGDAIALLAELDPGMRREVRDRILDEAEGNPLALVELSRGLIERGLHDAGGLPTRLPLSARLENVFADQVARLSLPAQDLLLLAAAGTGVTLTELGKAARELGIDEPEQRLREAERAELVRPAGDELSFRHPLIRSAIHGAASFPAGSPRTGRSPRCSPVIRNGRRGTARPGPSAATSSSPGTWRPPPSWPGPGARWAARCATWNGPPSCRRTRGRRPAGWPGRPTRPGRAACPTPRCA